MIRLLGTDGIRGITNMAPMTTEMALASGLADAGLVISASLNPCQDNGIKIFSSRDYKLPDALEHEIETLVSTGHISDIRPTVDEIGRAYRTDDAIDRYMVVCKNTFPDNLTLDGLGIAIDRTRSTKEKGALSNDPVIITQLSNFGPRRTFDSLDIRCMESSVDDRNVLELMKKEYTVLGGEEIGSDS